MNNQKDELLKLLTSLDFMAVDLALYLDTHPNDRAALSQYNSIITQADSVRRSYQEKYGPLYSFRSPSGYPWQWSQNPWPWDADFNFSLAGEER